MGKLEKAFELAMLLDGMVCAIILVAFWEGLGYPGIWDVIISVYVWGGLFLIGYVPIFSVYLICAAFRWVLKKGHEPRENLPVREAGSIEGRDQGQAR